MLSRRGTFDRLLLLPEEAELRRARARHRSRTEYANHAVFAVIPGFGHDLTGSEVRPGYAPDSWTGLIMHLRRIGVTDDGRITGLS